MVQPRILIVEDHPLMADALRAHLQSLVPRVQCVQAGNLHDGLACLQAQRFALVLIDLNLPDSEGLQTLNHFCSHCANDPLAVISAVDDESIAQFCLANNVVYLRKSVQSSQLLAELLSLLTHALTWPVPFASGLSVEQPDRHPLSNLSKMQRLVLAHLSQGHSTAEMAQALKLTEATVRSHMSQIYKRLGVKNRTQASTRYMLWTQQNGLFDDD